MSSQKDELAEKRHRAWTKRRRMDRQQSNLRNALREKHENASSKLLKVGNALTWLTVDERTALAYARVRLASRISIVDAWLRKSLKGLEQRAMRELQKECEVTAPRGRPPELSPSQERDVHRAYQELRKFFRDPHQRPDPQKPRDNGLLTRINAELSRLSTPRRLTLGQFERLTEEAAPNRLAKAAAGAAYGVSPAQVDKIVSRIARTDRSRRQ